MKRRVHQSLNGKRDGFEARGIKSEVSQHGDLGFEPDDYYYKKDLAVKKAVDRLNSQRVTSYADIATIVGVHLNVYLDYIKEEIDTERSFLELPWTIILVASFTVLVLGILQRDIFFGVQDAIENSLVGSARFAWSGQFGHKDIYDVDSISQFWAWMRLGLLPLVVQPSWIYSETVPPVLEGDLGRSLNVSRPAQWHFQGYASPSPVRNDFLVYSKLVGGIRMRQVVGIVSDCTGPSSMDPRILANWLDKPCVPSSFATLTPQAPDAEDFTAFDKTEFLLPDLDDFKRLQQKLLDMEDGCNAHIGNLGACLCQWCKTQSPRQPWLDERATRVEISMVFYNPQHGIYTYVSANFFLNRGGNIYKLLHLISSPAQPLAIPTERLIPIVLFGTIWGGGLLYMLIAEFRDIFRTIRSSHFGCFRAVIFEYFGFWNLVDWAAIASGAVAAIFSSATFFYIDQVNGLLPGMIAQSLSPGDPTDANSRQAYEAIARDFFVAVEQMSSATSVGSIAIVLYPFVGMLRLFKSFEAQPRLAIVTATLKTAAPDFGHFMLVIACVFACLLVSGILFLGQDLEDFSTPEHAFRSSLLAVLGNWDWQVLEEIGHVKAAFWLWVFSIVLSLISLNMLLAIILDAYSYEKEKASEDKTLLQQTSEVWRRRSQHRRGERVNLSQVYDAFKKEFKHDVRSMMLNRTLITPDSLMATVPKMPFEQALRTLSKALERHESREIGFQTEEMIQRDVQKNLEDFQIQLEDICSDVEHVAAQLDYFERLQASGDASYDFYFGQEQASEEKTSKEWIHKMITDLGGNLTATFHSGFQRYREWQGQVEAEQDELHESITDMQSLVQQHAGQVQEMMRAVDCLLDQGHTAGLSHATDT